MLFNQEVTMNPRNILILSTVYAFLYGPTVLADNQSGEHDEWQVSALIGIASLPLYLGDDDTQLSLTPDINIKYGDTFFASFLNGIGYNIVSTKHWQVGPIIKYDFGRDEEDGSPLSISGDDTDDLLGLGDIKGSVEAGAFLSYKTDRWQTKVEIRQGLDRGHEGLIGELEVKLSGQTTIFSKPLFYSIGPKAVYGDESYQQAYFGINSAQSIQSGLGQYTPKAGLVSYGLHANLVMPINKKWAIGGFAGHDKLGDDASDSPLIRERGSKNQSIGGIFFSYRF